jgi:hypothetical protein
MPSSAAGEILSISINSISPAVEDGISPKPVHHPIERARIDNNNFSEYVTHIQRILFITYFTNR